MADRWIIVVGESLLIGPVGQTEAPQRISYLRKRYRAVGLEPPLMHARRMQPWEYLDTWVGADIQRRSSEPVCVCTHLKSSHNLNDLCIALPGRTGCGCLGFLDKERWAP